MAIIRSKILGTGLFHPKGKVTNDDLSKTIQTSDEWIYPRTGIKQRYVCSTSGGEFPTDMAVEATKVALHKASLQPNDIDFIFFATTTPDYKLPNSATILQQKLGITNQCGCVDLAAACSGFVYGLNMADSMIKTGLIKRALIVGSEMLSREIDWTDRSLCILFGDGCGVAILGQNNDDKDPADIHGRVLSADGSGKEFFHQYHGGSVNPLTTETVNHPDRYMKMQGKEMFRVAVRTLVDNALLCLSHSNKTIDDIDWLIPHQANLRIIEATGERLGISKEKVIVNIDRYANTSAATIPIALHEAIEDGRIKRGDTLLLDAFGAGLTAGATVLTY
jgi:3-oxoacyl-[acyl-carrier-protein] synthase-3